MGTNETRRHSPGAGDDGTRGAPAEPRVRCGARLAATDLGRGTWIAVLRADAIPHVAMLQDGVCFSLEHDGNRRYPALKLWRMVEARRIPTLLCELGPWATAPVEATYARHRCIEGDGDCFLPVHEYCRACLSGCEDLGFPYRLLPWLSAGGKLARAGTLQLPAECAAQWFVLPTYSREEIRARIAEVRATLRSHGPDSAGH